MAKKGRLTKPSREKLGTALRGADTLVTARHEDTVHGKIGDQIVGPLYWDYLNLRDRCRLLLELEETPDWVRDLLRESVTWHGLRLTRK